MKTGKTFSKNTQSQVACKGFITESLRSTSISSLVPPDCIWVWVSLAYQLVNWLNYKQSKRAVNQKKSARCNEDRKDVFERHAGSEHFQNFYCFVFENGNKFRKFFKITKFAIINKNKVISLVKWFLIIGGRIAAFFTTSTSSTSGTRKVAISRGAGEFELLALPQHCAQCNIISPWLMQLRLVPSINYN